MRGTPYIFNSLGGGVNYEAAPYAISQNQARASVNWHTSPSGVIKKRNGCSLFSSPSVGGGNSLTTTFALHTPTRWIVGAGGTKLFKITTGGSPADLATGLTANLKWNFIQAPAIGAQGPLYGLNGTDIPKQWDGVAGSASNWVKTGATVNIPNGRFIEYHNNRVMIAGDPAFPSRLYESKLLDPTYFDLPDAITVDFEPSDGGDISALGHTGPYLLVFKPRKTYVLTNSDSGSQRSLSSEVGCVADRTVIETPSGTYFLSTDNTVYATDGTTLTPISDDVRPILKNIPAAGLANACAFYKDNAYWLSIAESGTDNTLALEYDTQTKTWWPHRIYTGPSTSSGVNDFTILNPATTAIPYGAISGILNPVVSEIGVDSSFQDFGNNYLCRWDGPWHVFGQPHIRKNIREIRVDALGQFDLLTARNFATAPISEEQTQWESASAGTTFGGTGLFGGVGVFGDVATTIETRYYTPGTCRAMSLRFESQNNLDCQIYAYTVSADMRTD